MRKLFALVALLALAAPARAEINGAPSLEWLTCSSEAVVLGSIMAVSKGKTVDGAPFADWTVDVHRALKGPPAAPLTLRRVGDLPAGRGLAEARGELLFFLVRAPDPAEARRLEGRWLPVLVVDPARPPRLWTREATPVAPAELLPIVERWARSPVRASLVRDVPPDSPMYRELWNGSSVYALVPAEGSYRAGFLRDARSGDASKRAEAARELAKFPGPETVAVLRGLLADPAEIPALEAADELAEFRLHVRAAARASLEGLGEAVPDLPLTRAPTAAERRELRKSYWTKAFHDALPGAGIDVHDGESATVGDRVRAVVLVEVSEPAGRSQWRLVPRGWAVDAPQPGRFVGRYGADSQGERRFFVSRDVSAAVVAKVASYFGLDTAPGR